MARLASESSLPLLTTYCYNTTDHFCLCTLTHLFPLAALIYAASFLDPHRSTLYSFFPCP